MRLPNKVINYNESILSKFPIILKYLKEKPYKVNDLYQNSRQYFKDINEFIETLDALYALKTINLNNGRLTIC